MNFPNIHLLFIFEPRSYWDKTLIFVHLRMAWEFYSLINSKVFSPSGPYSLFYI
jgi:hypothetical protein